MSVTSNNATQHPSKASDPIVIVGAGMTGMMAALLLRRRYPHSPIQIIESAASAGGNYRCINNGKGAIFDNGMRMLYETGIPEVDSLLHGILPESQWHIMPDNKKDIAGIFWKGHLQTYSPYIDLRRLPAPVIEQCRTELLRLIQSPHSRATENAHAYLHSRFGPTIADYLTAVLEKLHGHPARQLDILATKQPAVDRVVLFDCETMRPYMDLSIPWTWRYRARIAWPDQLSLPIARPISQAALYPKHFGMNGVIEALQTRLNQEGVELIVNDTIVSIARTGSRISTLVTKMGRRLNQPLNVFWTGVLDPLAKLLGTWTRDMRQPPLPDAAVVHLYLPAPPQMGPLYYLYCFDSGFHTFRVTHYSSYCQAGRQPEGYAICMELWNLKDGQSVEDIAVDELCRMGITSAKDRPVVAGVAVQPNLHAGCTLRATQAKRLLRKSVQQLSVENLTMLGIDSDDNLFLLYEVWRDMYRKIQVYDR